MINVSCSVNVKFTDEEKEVLQKARDILDKTSNELWKHDSDEVSDMAYIFGEPADQIKRILNGDY